jgi:hypothetical protein
MWQQYRFHHGIDVGHGPEVVESDLIIASPDEWDGSPEQLSGDWCAIRDGRRILALRLELSGPPYEIPAPSTASGTTTA